MQWSPDSWRSRPAKHIPVYDDRVALADVEARLSGFSPLVSFEDIRKLSARLAAVARGEAFLLQGGDCAETFFSGKEEDVYNFFATFLQMQHILSQAGYPVVKVGRIAGQFAKPRSCEVELLDGVALPVYRGDMINGHSFEESARTHDPVRQEAAYHQSLIKLGILQKLALNLSAPEGARIPDPVNTDLRISHEALLLGYEQALTRFDPDFGEWYATSAHMLWIGNKTRQKENAHVEYCRGIRNPVGLKCGPDLSPDDLLALADLLDPLHEPGRLILITRFGAEKIERYLPPLIRAIKSEGRQVVWSCDPMHGNTVLVGQRKTRVFERILKELKLFFDIHHLEGTFPGGIHIEMTGKNVTECIGGRIVAITQENLSERYDTRCDPRLNPLQSIELCFPVADWLKNKKRVSCPLP